MKIVLILAALAVTVFGLLIANVCIREAGIPKNADELDPDYEAIIVLGAQVKPDGVPSMQLSLRLDTALQVWERKHVPIVVCGAQGSDEPEPEAVTMKAYLAARGVPENMILMDPESMNTEQNLTNAIEQLKNNQQAVSNVIIVSSDYHVPRAMALAKDLGLEKAAGIGSPCLQEFWLKNHSREALAWVKYWLKKYLHLDI